MKRLLIIFIALILAGVSASAQKDTSGFYVQSFKKLDWDLDARVNYPVLDQNNRKAALIKVVIPATGFDFDFGIMGIVNVKQEVGEIWVYVPEGVKKITIRHKDYGVIRNYEFGCPIESATVYELTLHLPAKNEVKVVVRDSIIYVPTYIPVQTTVAEVRKREPIGLNVMAVGNIPNPAGGLMVAWNERRFGAYAKFITDLRSSHKSDNVSMWEYTSSSMCSVTAGATYRCLDWLRVGLGGGYGCKLLFLKNSKGKWERNKDETLTDIAFDLGVFLRFGRFTSYIGVSNIALTYYRPELGIGYVF